MHKYISLRVYKRTSGAAFTTIRIIFASHTFPIHSSSCSSTQSQCCSRQSSTHLRCSWASSSFRKSWRAPWSLQAHWLREIWLGINLKPSPAITEDADSWVLHLWSGTLDLKLLLRSMCRILPTPRLNNHFTGHYTNGSRRKLPGFHVGNPPVWGNPARIILSNTDSVSPGKKMDNPLTAATQNW